MLKNTITQYDPHIARIFLPWAWRYPRYLKSFLHLRKTYLTSEKTRAEFRKKNIRIPPFLILSITHHCNIQCSHCFAIATGTVCNYKDIASLSIDNWKKIITEANECGVFGFVLAGGEPFLYPDLLKLPEMFQDCFFIIFSNGTLINSSHVKRLQKLGNVAVLISVEGNKEYTDERRGKGVYDQAMTALKQLRKQGIIHGISTTITQDNYRFWMNNTHIDELIGKGIRIGVFLEYIPVSCKKEEFSRMLTVDQRKEFRSYILRVREEKKMYVVHSPGDEEFFGGCVSAGRGFAHVTPKGDITPCPVSNIATHNLTTSSFLEAMQSPLFKRIREEEQLLETEGFPCALFAHPKEVEKIASSVDAYRTDET